ncbi:MAG: ribosome-associated translation inhibitor RaiA [Bacteroidales bacterium]|nr:ribosome-associated translation inhibitor RaiA [Bacteroidales bacterium]
MEIKIKSLKFDADSKLIAYVEKKVGKIEKFFDNTGDAEVTLSLLNEPDGKQAKILVHVPGEDLIVERSAKTFEDAITQAADAMKERLTRNKEKKYTK